MSNGNWVTRYLAGDFVAIQDEWFCGTTLERIRFYDADPFYDADEWSPAPGVALTSSRRAARHYALSSDGTPILVTLRVSEWLLWAPYRPDVTSDMINDHRNVWAMRATLGPDNQDDAVIISDPVPDAPEALALIVLSEEAAADITVTEHVTLP